MRRRVSFGFSLPPALDVRRQVQLAIFLEWMGYDRLWLPDHLGYPDWSQAPCVWTVLAAIASRTRRIEFATGVSDPHRVPPAVFAQRAATLDQLSRGRLTIGLGSGEAMNLEPFGIPWDRRVTRLRESLTIIRAFLDQAGDVTYNGDIHKVHNARLAIRPYQERHIPIHLAALGPKAQKLCGEICDGWVPVVIPPAHYAHYFEPIAESARAAGRDPDAIERVATLPLALVDDERGARDLAAKAARRYALTLVWPPVAERMGMALNAPPHLAGTHYITVNPADPESVERYREFQRWIPEEVLMQFVNYGRMEKLRRAVGDYIDAGATHINVVNVSPDPLTSTVRFATELLGHFTGRAASLSARMAQAALPVARRFVKIPGVS